MTSTPQPEHVGLVYAGGTATAERPAPAALKLRMVRNCDQPASWMDAGEVVIPDPVGGLQVLVIDCVVGAHQRKRRLVVEILALTSHRLRCPGE